MQTDNLLPLKVDPFRSAENQITLQGTLSIENMQRLCTSLTDVMGQVAVNLVFGKDEQGIRYIKGHLDTQLHLQCQRCLEPFKYEIMGDFLAGIVHTEQEAEALPERYDPLIILDNMLILSDMIEDELIISLPIVPMHALKDCSAQLSLMSSSQDMTEAEKDNPFKVIELLRSKRDSK